MQNRAEGDHVLRGEVFARSLQLPAQLHRREIVADPYQQTCQWLWLHKEFQSWISAPCSRFLFVSGKPGCGKSVLAKQIYTRVLAEKSSLKYVACYFSNGYGNGLERGMAGILRSLLSEVIRQNPALTSEPSIVQEYEILKESRGDPFMHWSSGTFKRIFRSLGNIGKHEFFFLVDALDEAEPEEVSEISRFLEELVVSDTKSSFKILLTARPQAFLQEFPHAKYPRIWLESSDSEFVQKDIQTYITEKVNYYWKTEKFSASLIEKLYERSNGIFLWVELVLVILAEERKQGTPISDLLKLLNEVPIGMEELYRNILDRLPEERREFRRIMLQWVLCAERPLSIEEYRLAVTMTHSPNTYVNEDLICNQIDLELFKLQIASHCGGLVEFRQSKTGSLIAHLVHQSASDFLTKNPAAWYVNINKAEDLDWCTRSHFQLASTCLEYLSSCNLEEGPTNSDRPWGSQKYTNRANPQVVTICSCLLDTSSQPSKRPILKHVERNMPAHGERKTCIFRVSNCQLGFERNLAFPRKMQLLHHVTELGHDSVTALLLRNGISPNLIDGHGRSPLSYAAEKGHLATVKVLLLHVPNLNHRGGRWNTALWAAAVNGHISVVQCLIDHGAVVDLSRRLLSRVASRDYTSILELLLKHHLAVNVDSHEFIGSSLMSACKWGHTNSALLLLKNSAQVNFSRGFKGTALQAAALNGHEQLVTTLLANEAEVNTQNGQYGSPLQAACARGHRGIAELLIKSKADVDLKGGKYGSPLQAACAEGHRDIVDLLLKERADVDSTGGEYGSPLQAALFLNQPDVVELLLKQGATINRNQPSEYYGFPLQVAALQGRLPILQMLLNLHADVNMSGGHYGSALQAACAGNRALAVDLLIENGADVRYKDGKYDTALHAAAVRGFYPICERLIASGASVHECLGEFGAPLHAAATYGYENVVQLLLEKGADPNQKGTGDRLAVSLAADGGHLSTVKILMDRSRQLGVCLEGCDSALSVLKRRGDIDAV
jgi:ankyrin repeat protein